MSSSGPRVVSPVRVGEPIRTGWDTAPIGSETPGGTAGGVLAGHYPNPTFAQDMATQAELNIHVGAAEPHASYDDLPSLSLLFQNGLV